MYDHAAYRVSPAVPGEEVFSADPHVTHLGANSEAFSLVLLYNQTALHFSIAGTG